MMVSDPKRIERRLKAIAACTEESGKITRRTFSKAWEEAVAYVRGEMEDAGMTVRMDTFGNLIGRYDPAHSDQKPIGIGSHIDSVINAGAYDGVAGIVIGLELVSMLHENRVILSRPIEVLATADEEGAICQKGYFGGRFMTGDMTVAELLSYRDADGNNLTDLQSRCPEFSGRTFGSDNGWAKNYYHCFLEVHVEQGNVLESKGKDMGIVKGVAGIGRLVVEISGVSDHAGPTVMEGRRDALVAASDLVLKVWNDGQLHSGDLVATVGRMHITPNTHNVIPGHVELVIDYRSDRDVIAMAAAQRFKSYILDLEKNYGVKAEISREIYTPVKEFSPYLLRRLREMQVPNSMELYSWAGHDAKAFSEVTDTAMLFMPSVGGKSHCPEEFTETRSFQLVCDHLVHLLEPEAAL